MFILLVSTRRQERYSDRWSLQQRYHKQAANTCVKDCNVTNCAGYTLSSCPANGNCSTCTKTAANCSTDGTMYKLDSCKDGYSKSGDTCIKGCPNGQTLVDGSCVACASSLTFKSMYGSIETAKKVLYNGINYAVYTLTNGGIGWPVVNKYCTAIDYNRPDYNFAKYLITNKNTLGLDITVNDSGFVYTSTQCGSTQYLGCNSPTNCPCFSKEEGTYAHSYVCVKPLCSANVTAETCPSGYSLNACGYGETAVSTTTGSQGSTCYKCSCAAGYNSLTFRTIDGYANTAKKVTYNGETYAVTTIPYHNGMSCALARRRCAEEEGYILPDYDFAKFLIKNKVSLGVSSIVIGGGTAGVCTSTQCGSNSYLGCSNSTSCACLYNDEGATATTSGAVCVKKVCAAAVKETCPSGYQLEKCSGYTNPVQTGTATSSLGNTCYKCEDKSSSSGSSGTNTCIQNGWHPECCATGFTGKKCYIPNYNCAAKNSCTSWDLQHTYANCIRDLGGGYYCCSQCSGYEVN